MLPAKLEVAKEDKERGQSLWEVETQVLEVIDTQKGWMIASVLFYMCWIPKSHT